MSTSLKKSLLLFCFTTSTFANILFGQIANYNISDYARPDLNRKTMGLFPDFRFQNYERSNLYETNTIIRDYIRLSSSPTWTQGVFKNTARHQTSQSMSANIELDFVNSRNGNGSIEPGKKFILNPEFSYAITRRKFVKGSKFRELNASFKGNIDYSSNKDLISEKTDRVTDIQLQPTVSFYFGKGRIEYINDAWHAIRILEMLEEKSLLKSAVDSVTIQAFAEEISRIKNFRNTDNRLESIAEFEALCTFLVDNDVVDKNDYRFFATLSDTWRYESFTSRYSGKQFKYGPRLRTIFNNYETIVPQFSTFEPPYMPGDTLQEFYSFYDLSFVVTHTNYKPISNAVQFDKNISLRVGTTRGKRHKENRISSYSYYTNLSFGGAFRYLPSRRSNYTLRLNTTLSYEYAPTHEGRTVKQHTLKMLPNVNLDYDFYISPQFIVRISGGLSINSSAESTKYSTDSFQESFKSAYFTLNNELRISVDYWFY